MDFDSVLLEIGEFGRYQQLVMWLLCIPGCLMNAYNAYALAFLTYTPDHRCKLPAKKRTFDNISWDSYAMEADECEVRYFYTDGTDENGTIARDGCSEWDYDTEIFDSTLITRFNLVCDKAIDAKIMLSIIAAVAVGGCVMYAWIQDRWGRRVAFEVNVVTYCIGGVVSLFMPNFIAYTAVRLIASLSAISTWNICYIWAIEYTGPSKRTLVTTVMCVMYALSNASLSLVAYFCRTWLQLGLTTTAPFVLLLSYHFIVMESPRWLLSKGRVAEAKKVLNLMMKIDGKKTADKEEESLDHLLKRLQDASNVPAVDVEERTNPLDLFRGPTLRRKTLIITFNFVSCAVLYTSIAYNAENLGGNFLVTWALQSLVEAPATIANLFMLNRYGRIWPMAISTLLAGVFCLLCAPSEYFNPVLVIVLAISGKFCICMSYAIIYQLGGELLPTVVRGLGIGFASVIGDLGNISMPYIIYSATAYKMLPMVIMGFLAVVSGTSGLFLPETLGRSMPQTLDDGETHGKVNMETFRGHFKRLCGKKEEVVEPGTNHIEEGPYIVHPS